MPTNDERREVARRLRENAEAHPDMSLLLNVAFADDRLRPDGAMEWEVTPHDAAMRLADLIEPSCDRDTPQKVAEEMFGKMRHSTKEEADAYEAMLKSMNVEIHPVDREALLALADEMTVEKGDIWRWSSRIREALGVK